MFKPVRCLTEGMYFYILANAWTLDLIDGPAVPSNIAVGALIGEWE